MERKETHPVSSPSREIEVPFITTEQMREVDRAAVEDYGILLLQMMENAGRSLACLCRSRFLQGDPRGKRVLVLAGRGGNGGGGLVCARHAHNWGADVVVKVTARASALSDASRHQLDILQVMGVQVEVATQEMEFPAGDLVVDALVGYGLRGVPTGATASLIRAANASGFPVVSLDVPSGVDSTTGSVHDPAIRATATMTLALPKKGLRSKDARDYVGELYLADIGIPSQLYKRPALGLTVGHIFATRDTIRLW